MREIVGKSAALATPIFAFAAIIICSASLTSGRDSKREEGSPEGGVGGVITASIATSGITKFMSPERTLNWLNIISR